MARQGPIRTAARETVESGIDVERLSVRKNLGNVDDRLDCQDPPIFVVIRQGGVDRPVFQQSAFGSGRMGLLAARAGGAKQRAARGDQTAPRIRRIRGIWVRRLRLQLHPQPPPANERPPDDASLLKYM